MQFFWELPEYLHGRHIFVTHGETNLGLHPIAADQGSTFGSLQHSLYTAEIPTFDRQQRTHSNYHSEDMAFFSSAPVYQSAGEFLEPKVIKFVDWADHSPPPSPPIMSEIISFMAYWGCHCTLRHWRRKFEGKRNLITENEISLM